MSHADLLLRIVSGLGNILTMALVWRKYQRDRRSDRAWVERAIANLQPATIPEWEESGPR